jgi:hypothetical protein
MELTFTLPDGTRAGIRPSRELEHLTVGQLGMKCLTPAPHVSVVFHVADRAALERLKARYGLGAC